MAASATLINNFLELAPQDTRLTSPLKKNNLVLVRLVHMHLVHSVVKNAISNIKVHAGDAANFKLGRKKQLKMTNQLFAEIEKTSSTKLTFQEFYLQLFSTILKNLQLGNRVLSEHCFMLLGKHISLLTRNKRLSNSTKNTVLRHIASTLTNFNFLFETHGVYLTKR